MKQKCYPESEGVHSWGICYLVCPVSQINELKVCKRDSVCWKASIWFLCLMQLYQASTSRNWWGLWPRFCKQGIEALTHLSVLTGTLNSDDWLCKAKVTGLTSLAKSLLMLMCLVPGLWWASFCKRQGHSCSWRNPVLHRYSGNTTPAWKEYQHLIVSQKVSSH